jgi:hypothetical protein
MNSTRINSVRQQTPIFCQGFCDGMNPESPLPIDGEDEYRRGFLLGRDLLCKNLLNHLRKHIRLESKPEFSSLEAMQ